MRCFASVNRGIIVAFDDVLKETSLLYRVHERLTSLLLQMFGRKLLSFPLHLCYLRELFYNTFLKIINIVIQKFTIQFLAASFFFLEVLLNPRKLEGTTNPGGGGRLLCCTFRKKDWDWFQKIKRGIATKSFVVKPDFEVTARMLHLNISTDNSRTLQTSSWNTFYHLKVLTLTHPFWASFYLLIFNFKVKKG